MGAEFGVKVRERIHWITSCVEGECILDIGCSQGIVSILLGREGRRVLGVDLMKESIDFARSKLSLEPMSVQKMVEFRCDNVLTYEFGDTKFDTVIMGELLEHLTNSEGMLQRAASLLKSTGKAIVTVPFGIMDYIDHKKSYYLFDLIHEVEANFMVTDICFFGKWVGLTAVLRKEGSKSVISAELGKLLEQEFYKIERTLIDDNAKAKISLTQSNKELSEVKEILASTLKTLQFKDDLLEQLGKLSKLNDQLLTEVSGLKEALKEKEICIRSLQEHFENTAGQWDQAIKDITNKYTELLKKNKE
jgi:2-polyprenyl-6-hydroxyphenyl methylase/3-demethylubiquinone-9 3-methyltransferase